MIINRVFNITFSSTSSSHFVGAQQNASYRMPPDHPTYVKPPDKSQPPCAGPIVTTTGQWGNDQHFCWLSNGCIISSVVIKCIMLCTMSSKKVRRAHTFIKYEFYFSSPCTLQFRVLREQGDCNFSDFSGVQLFDY